MTTECFLAGDIAADQLGGVEVLGKSLPVSVHYGVAQHDSSLTQILVRDKLTLPNDRSVTPYDGFMLDLNRLRILRAVVSSGSVNETARRLGYTPSTVSQHLHTLEREVGFALISRVGRGIVPTPAAVELASAADEVLQAMTKLTARTRDLRDGATERLTLRSFASAAYTWMPSVARTLRQEFPELTLELAIDVVESAETAGDADIEIHTELPYLAPVSASGYRRHVLCEDEFVMAMPDDHPLAGADRLDLAEFAEDDWVEYDYQDQLATGLASYACAEAGFSPRYVARAQDHVSGLAFVAAGVGITLIPVLTTRWSGFNISYVRIQNPTPYRRIVALSRNAIAAQNATVRVLELLGELAAVPGAVPRTLEVPG
ncbi:MAG TPA: LysR family transcriptional regulator [Propionibacteriaceae bacterium]|nr:LysR family transcriptional regulator [Propionibacteriaceae bacterium]